MAADGRKKYALITGCTPGGIGHYLSLEFADKGYHVLSTVRDPSKYTSPHPNITYVPLELSSIDSIQSLEERVSFITGGQLHILYNNAGRNYTVPALDIRKEELHDLFQTNVYSVMHMCQAFTPLLIETKGVIVQTGSVAAIMPYVWGSAYNASKAALHAYSNTLRVELAPLGVRVINIITGGVKSNIARVHRDLPPDSYMLPLADEYESRLTHSQQVGQDTEKYAKSCVRHVLQGDGWLLKKRWVWEGNLSWLVWFMWSWMPHSLFDYYFTWKFKLGRLQETAKNKKTI
ncbi:NAD(P)-binding protein [Lophiostoma macrostomum CBS 122681]|uniref:NAD(P)-binding protein n=1 Tax=Lophiostoma macrostomum CBS 122681 TaxID=1314788 RepID=A0A6A6SZA7_9PLEO|nr:NAD(P)-binding protein [Lophiostoma macrostomum CBS 122681]